MYARASRVVQAKSAPVKKTKKRAKPLALLSAAQRAAQHPGVFRVDGDDMLCIVCKKTVSTKGSTVTNHLKSQSHAKNHARARSSTVRGRVCGRRSVCVRECTCVRVHVCALLTMRGGGVRGAPCQQPFLKDVVVAKSKDQAFLDAWTIALCKAGVSLEKSDHFRDFLNVHTRATAAAWPPPASWRRRRPDAPRSPAHGHRRIACVRVRFRKARLFVTTTFRGACRTCVRASLAR